MRKWNSQSGKLRTFFSAIVVVALIGGQGLRAEKPAERPREESLEQQKANLKVNVEKWEDRVRRRLSRFEELANTVSLHKLEPQQAAVKELRATLSELDLGAQELLQAYADLGPDLKLYRQALLQGPAVFNNIADDFDRKALAKQSSSFKEAYADFSGQARKWAANYAERAKGIDALEADINRKMAFVEESREFIADAQGFLAAIPSEGGLESERLLTRLNEYIDLFERTLKALRTLGDKVCEPETGKTASSASAASASRRNVSEPRTTGVAATLEGFRQRLVSDQQH